MVSCLSETKDECLGSRQATELSGACPELEPASTNLSCGSEKHEVGNFLGCPWASQSHSGITVLKKQ